ncbi:tRNA synthetases class I family protein, partial [Chlamydia psittaci C1/97]
CRYRAIFIKTMVCFCR